jgi:hypothetical protein
MREGILFYGGLFVDKKFTFGLIALLSVSLFLLGCQNDSSRVSIPAAKTPEQLAADLVKALGGAKYAKAEGAKVTLIENAIANDDLTVAAGVTLETKGKGLNIKKNFMVNGNVILNVDVTPTYDVTVDTTGVITVTGNKSKLTIAKAKKLENKGTITLTDGGSIVLTGDAGNGAKLTGTGKVVVGATEIIGGKGGWQAVGNSGNVTIKAGASTADKTAIIAATTSALTAGAGATITQLAVAKNNLDIAMNSIINLGNASGKKLGSIVFKQSSSNPAQVTLGALGVVIKVSETAGTAASGAIGMFVIGNPANDKLLCSSLTTPSGITINTDSGKLCKIVGGNSVQTIKAQAFDQNGIADVVLSAESAVK